MMEALEAKEPEDEASEAYAKWIEECEQLAKASAEVTHNHPDGIKGACATAAAVYLARVGKSKDEIKKYVTKFAELFKKDVNFLLNSTFYVLTPDSNNPYKELYIQN